MAHLFKPATQSTRGIVVFTHKELDRFFRKVDLPKEHFQQRYFCGTHYGGVQAKLRKKRGIESFILGTERAVRFLEPQPFRIPFSSRNFTPTLFKPDRRWNRSIDVLCVARCHKVKNLHQLVGAVRELYNDGHMLRAHIVIPGQRRADSNYYAIEKDYRRLFSESEQKRFTLEFPDPEYSFRGMPQSKLVSQYQKARVFVLPSVREGSPKVLSEALLCGCVVVVNKGLKGGGLDYLDADNAVFFDRRKRLSKALMQAVDRSRLYQCAEDDLANKLREDRVLLQLHDYFDKLYKKHNEVYDGSLINTDNLNFRLPGHYHDVPWFNGNKTLPADIVSRGQFLTFLDYVKEHE
jgi:glycosyltransferase involved in cell wall biosynthesis